MSNPPQAGPATPDPRPRLPTTNHGPAATRIREYQHDRASRTSTAGPPSTQPTTTPPNGANAPLQAVRLDKRECPRICVGMSERDRHVYEYEKPDAEERAHDRARAPSV